MKAPLTAETGILFSGGLDSTILLAHLLSEGKTVQPFYVETGLFWEAHELDAADRVLAALDQPGLLPLVRLAQPVHDLYGAHWSMTGHQVPDAHADDREVYLPGRNALLLLKAALWCQLRSVPELALAPLGTSPFGDATHDFFEQFERTLELAGPTPLKIRHPFGCLDKCQVMEIGRGFPLELTFSCIAPVGPLHCGQCNKCAERQTAFASAALTDATRYASRPAHPCSPADPALG